MIASRLLSILLRLRLGPVSARQLVEDLEVSARTIYRDVDQLSAAGVPIYCDRGRHGGIRLLEGWSVKAPGFTTADINALLTVHDPEILKDLGLALPLDDAQLKLLLALPESADRERMLTSQRLLIDPVQWFRRRDRPPHLHLCAKAVWEGWEVTFAYRSWTRSATRRLHPLGVVLKAGVWYLVGQGPRGTRIFRIDQIADLALTGERFERPADFDLGCAWRDAVAEFETGLVTASADLTITEEGLRRLDRMGTHVVEAANRTRRAGDRDGWWRVTIPIEGVEHATYELLALGRHVRVVSPDALRQAINGEMRAALAAAG